MFELALKKCYFKVREEKGDRVLVVTHHFRPPFSEDWFDFFRGTSQLGLSKGRDVIEMSNAGQEKDEEFWEKLILEVEGYQINGRPLMEFPEWKSKVPLTHKLNAIAGFMYFFRVGLDENPVEETVLDLGETTTKISFDALQLSKPCQVSFEFAVPEPSDYIRYSRATARMQIVRTKQRGVSKLQVPSNVQLLVELFNKLVVVAEGYSYDGKALMDFPDWKDKIDVYHKREAVRELFGTTLQEEER